MSKNVTIALLGVVVLVLGGVLVNQGCDPVVPPDDPPPPPTPPPQSPEEKPCEFQTVEFKVMQDEVTTEDRVFAIPEVLDVQDCGYVIFTNRTNQGIEIIFLEINGEKKSPFATDDIIELEAYETENQYSKGDKVTVEIDPDAEPVEFYYKVIAEDPPEAEQSPRIRVGPRKVID